MIDEIPVKEKCMPCYRAVLVWCLWATAASAADWPQWLGPNRDGSCSEKVQPWTSAPKVLWRQPVGEGHSSPIVANGRVYLHVKAKDKDEEELAAFDAQSGKDLWRTSYARSPFSSPFGQGPRATPAFSDNRLYTFGVTGLLTCFDAISGSRVWQVDTLKQFQAPNLQFGVSCSPLIEGDRVLVNVGGKGASIVAFSKDKGNVLWQSLDDPASYSSPIAFGKGGERQVVFLTQKGLVSLNATSGALFWKEPLVDLLSESSITPVRAGDLLLGSAVTAGSIGVRVESKDGKPAATQVWKNPKLTCYFSTPVPVGEQLYMVTGTIIPPPGTTLRCVDPKTGNELWSKSKVGKYHAALLRTGDNKLLMLDDAGNLILLQPDPKEYRELARSKVCGATWAHPAVADGRLYVRDDKELLCLQLVP